MGGAWRRATDAAPPVPALYRRRYKICTGAPAPGVVLELPPDGDDDVRPVLPGRESHGSPRRAVDASGGPRAAARQHPLQRPATGRPTKMSPGLLSKRLRSSGRVVTRRELDGHARYHLTPAGRESCRGRGGSRPLGHAVDRRGRRRGPRPAPAHVGIRRTVPVEQWPRARTVLAFHLDGVDSRAARWWLVVAEGAVDLCDFDPGWWSVTAASAPACGTSPGSGAGTSPGPRPCARTPSSSTPRRRSDVRYLSGWDRAASPPFPT